MTDHRYQARADIAPGERELVVGGSRIGLVRLTLTDAGPVTRPDGSDYERPDVICPLRACEARRWPAGCSSSPTKPTPRRRRDERRHAL